MEPSSTLTKTTEFRISHAVTSLAQNSETSIFYHDHCGKDPPPLCIKWKPNHPVQTAQWSLNEVRHLES